MGPSPPLCSFLTLQGVGTPSLSAEMMSNSALPDSVPCLLPNTSPHPSLALPLATRHPEGSPRDLGGLGWWRDRSRR